MMRSIPATMDASSVTSIANVTMPRDSSAAMRSTRRATAYTVQPDSARWMAMDSPMPEDAPVTRATLFIRPPYAGSRGQCPAAPRPAPNRREARSRWEIWPLDRCHWAESGLSTVRGRGSGDGGLGLLVRPGVLPVDEVDGAEVVPDV